MRPRNRFAPQVELLEQRRVPAITATQTGDTLLVRGTGDDTFDVVATRPGAFRVTPVLLGQTPTPQNFAGINDVVINLGGGTNTLNLILPPAAVTNTDVDINGNNATNGTDNVNVNLGSGLTGNEDIHIDADLGNGTNNFTVGGNLGRTRAATLNRNADLHVDYEGGSGVDTVIFNFLNINRGADAQLDIDLGAGNDLFRFNMPLQGPNGVLDDDADVRLNLDGGTGTDTGIFSARASDGIDADVRNIERGNLAILANTDDDDDDGDNDDDDDDDNDHGNNNGDDDDNDD
jgi:hypothetical protein